MKRITVLLFCICLVFAAAGCAGQAAGSEEVTGFVYIEGDTLYLEEVEIVMVSDYDRACELGL